MDRHPQTGFECVYMGILGIYMEWSPVVLCWFCVLVHVHYACIRQIILVYLQDQYVRCKLVYPPCLHCSMCCSMWCTGAVKQVPEAFTRREKELLFTALLSYIYPVYRSILFY